MPRYFVQIVHSTVYSGDLDADDLESALCALNADRDARRATVYTRDAEGSVYAKDIESGAGKFADFWDDEPDEQGENSHE